MARRRPRASCLADERAADVRVSPRGKALAAVSCTAMGGGDKGGSSRALYGEREMVDELPPPLYAVCEYMTCL